MATEVYDEEELDEEQGQRRTARRDSVPDKGVDNAMDVPLLPHAGTSKSNTISYLKITRLDGARGVRGLKGQMPPGTTYDGLARRFGNGTYKIEGCNAAHKVLAREEAIEIAMGPDFDDANGQPIAVVPQPQNSAAYTLHGMKMVSDMATRHQEAVMKSTDASSAQVKEMASTTMEMLTTFTAAQRESERNSYQAAQQNQQAFFASMMAMQQSAHAQQMQMLTTMAERERANDVNPLQMIEVFMNGMKAGGEMGDGPEPWLQALKEGSGMLGNIAQLANAPGVRGALPSNSVPNRTALPAAAIPTNAPANDNAGPPTRKKRLPFDRAEIRAAAQLKAELRKRGIPMSDFLTQTTDYYRTAPESELYESDDEGQDELADAANPSDEIA